MISKADITAEEIQSFRLFNRLNPDLMKIVYEGITSISAKAGMTVCVEGTKSNSMFLIKKGSVVILKENVPLAKLPAVVLAVVSIGLIGLVGIVRTSSNGMKFRNAENLSKKELDELAKEIHMQDGHIVPAKLKKKKTSKKKGK